ncbi:hypothetical protein TanjilG_25251 [Lupinus angustifolius]|uniref:Legume lectin domain-containing protein n=1 Tax=Lupinus angustifolius TaxID=3871 RepID=A0A4P1RVK1_LUPAN|nr:PREDICTED: uncharacterized protein LOC109352631 [Lupinus angustifolius]XP_019450319.1 PREDICTED: uncharacterized protein LOC109352631 [Lupinus angustifolius]XP_019450328.1 PREDICTED: uncharacterized protein LOC109352631 [Lupinus angustifolius]XP_019450337.1 PREDICTED: uncharacterized protein LOC109352631 [Lupinus angustifolius]OIW18808.1 hypothetical protein TanjilG_25251 [Lupinus angustifolius]
MGLLLWLSLLISLPHLLNSLSSTTTTVTAVATTTQAKALDAILQHYAYMALITPITGAIYNATNLPSNFTGVKVAALRLRSGSLRRRGFSMYNEFQIPKGIIEKPYVTRLVLVYHNLGDLSTRYYSLPNYTYLAPVLGLLAYDGSNLSATNLPELNVKASADPINIKFQDVKSAPDGTVAKCVWFDLQGSSNFTNVTGGNTCSTTQQGHYSIVVESTALPPAPAPAPLPPALAPSGGSPNLKPSGKGESKSNKKKVWIIVGSVLGGLALLALLSLLVLWAHKYKQKKKIQQMERAADVGEALHMASIGDTRAPAATVTRTQPTIEHEYTP